MRVLILSSGNIGDLTSFVREQGLSLRVNGIEIDFFLIKGKSYKGYLSNLSGLNNKISSFKPDLIHAHYGLTALLANFQRKIPVISTFHGSDIWVYRKNLLLSQIAHILSKQSVIVSSKMAERLVCKKKISIIPCGVDLVVFTPLDKQTAVQKMNLPENKLNVLFSSKFDYFEKNYPVAKKAMMVLGDNYNLIELRGYSRTEVNLLLNGCDVALMTSFSEGSPQFIKEAMACNCPVVSTDVGDVKEVFGDTRGCYITSFEPEDVAEKVKAAIEFRQQHGQTKGRERIIGLGLGLESIALRIITVYNKVLGEIN